MESLYRIINVFQPGVIFLQETKIRVKNKLKLRGYHVFENIRVNSAGGGLMTAVHESLNPVDVSLNDDTEILTVEAKVNKFKVRFINGYGVQENSSEEQKRNFYDGLDLEIKRAKTAGAFICVEMDSNAKLGSKFIPEDPKPMSENGKYLEKIIEDNNLIVVNGTSKCHGLIPRYRKTVNGEEAAVIDHLLVCSRFFEMISTMTIAESGKFALTKYTNRRGDRTCKKESDHRTIIIETNKVWNPNKLPSNRVEIFDYNNKDNFQKYIEMTSNNKELDTCFDTDEDIEIASKKWLKIFTNIIKSSFRKIRLKNQTVSPEIDKLFQKKEGLKEKLATLGDNADSLAVVDELEATERKIAELCAERNRDVVNKFIGCKDDVIEGFSHANTWSLMKKLSPKNTIDPPAAKKDKDGNLITDLKHLESLYLDTYESRLKPHQISEDLIDLREMKDSLLDAQIKSAAVNVSADWTLSDLEKTLKALKNNKARDDFGHTYELFKYGGLSLKISLLKLLNKIKTAQTYPSILQISNITSIWKRKGDKADLDNDRGIFIVSKIRSILDKMIYNDIYQTVDSSMSSSNIGARKQRNIREHLFVIHAIINDVINNKDTSDIDIQIYDVEKCFDKLEFTNTAIDFYNAGVQDDKFITILNSNKNCDVAVKTPWGQKTQRIRLNNIEMQGTVLAGLKCSVSIDLIGKEALENAHEILYKYKKCTSIPPLGLIDDILSITECSPTSVKASATIKAKLQSKQLNLHEKKCFQMHIGNQKSSCSHTNHSFLKSSSSQRYLGDVLSTNSKIDENISDRFNKGIGYVNQILGILHEISFGKYYFEQALQLRNAKLINGMLCSIEAIHGLSKNHIETLEKCDRYLFRKLFDSPQCTPTESFYIELNALPLRFIIMARRLLFYWTILNKPDTELVKQVFRTQQLLPVRNDWCLTIEDDLKSLGIDLKEKDIQKMKKGTFKSLVSKRIRIEANKFLNNLKDKHSKSSSLKVSNNIQEYLSTYHLSTQEKQVLFKLRIRSFDCKANYPNKFNSLQCDFCEQIDYQDHLLDCIASTEGLNTQGIKYSDIFGNISQQIKVAKVM